MARVEIASQAWGWLVDSTGTPLSSASATLKNVDGTNATTYSAITGGSSSTAALTSASDGTLPRYVEEGSYDLTVGATTRRVEASKGGRTIQIDYHIFGPTPDASKALVVSSGIASYGFPADAASASSVVYLAGTTAEVVHAYWWLIWTPNSTSNFVELQRFESISGGAPVNGVQIGESTPSSSSSPIQQTITVTSGIQTLAETAASGVITASAFNRCFGHRVKTGASAMTIFDSRLSIRFRV